MEKAQVIASLGLFFFLIGLERAAQAAGGPQ